MGQIERGTVRNEMPPFEMEYLRFGEGSDAFVILPGLSLQSVLPAGEAIAAQYHEIGGRYTCYLLDRRQAIPPDYSMEEIAADTAAAMERLGLQKVVLYGCSMGGMLAQCIAASYPALVGKLILSSTWSELNEVSRANFSRWIALAEAGDAVLLNRDMRSHIYSPAYLRRYRAAFEAIEGVGNREELQRFAVYTRACLHSDSRSLLKSLHCPTLVIGAEHDLVLGKGSQRALAAQFGCTSYVYPVGYSHAVYDEAEDFVVRLLKFLEEK